MDEIPLDRTALLIVQTLVASSAELFINVLLHSVPHTNIYVPFFVVLVIILQIPIQALTA